MNDYWIKGASLILPNEECPGALRISQGLIIEVRRDQRIPADGIPVLDGTGFRVCPGFVDLHVHGGGGADFMDGTPESFRLACLAHARHGTTSLLATTTAASPDHLFRMLLTAQGLVKQDTGGARVMGVHLYGPHFHGPAKGCHPEPERFSPEQIQKLMNFAPILTAATLAPEHPDAESFAVQCVAHGIRLHMGHSHCTFTQAETAVGWGVRHVDHLFCAMSDRARLRLEQTWPMRGGLFEATLCLDELSTEVIADGCHLSPELLRLAWKVKGPNRLALVTDAMRAMDLPAGEYVFGPSEAGVKVFSNGKVGLMQDGKALASAIQGMDHGIRQLLAATGEPLWRIIQTASLIPARIAGLDNEIGSLEVGKRADLVWLDEGLRPVRVWVGGREIPELVKHPGN